MISIRNLNYAFNQKVVLDGLHITFEEPKIIGIAGLNGAGKSTFFNVLSGLYKTNEQVLFRNDQPLDLNSVGYLETNNFFYSNITGNEYLKIFNNSNQEFKLDNLQAYFQLPLDNLIDTYSTGMKKKLALLSLLKQDKQIYLLDEPFNGLDLESNKILEWLIAALFNKGKTVFISSHIIDPLLSVCHQICYLESGKFTGVFEKSQFHLVEEAIFGKLRQEAQQIIQDSI
ncbi:MAG: ATP-binding cassette domain-containing protein [Bacteroidota bacterium]